MSVNSNTYDDSNEHISQYKENKDGEQRKEL